MPIRPSDNCGTASLVPWHGRAAFEAFTAFAAAAIAAPFQKEHFPAIHRSEDSDGDAGPSSSHNNGGTRFGDVRATMADSGGGRLAGGRGRPFPRRPRAHRRKPRRPRPLLLRQSPFRQGRSRQSPKPPSRTRSPRQPRLAVRNRRWSASSAPGVPTPPRRTARRYASRSPSLLHRKPIRRIGRAIRPMPSSPRARRRKSTTRSRS